MNNISSIIENPAFNKLEPRKLKILVEMINEMGNNTIEQKMQVLFTYNIKMKQNGIQFTSEETTAIIDTLKETLSPADRNKLDMLNNMLGMMNKK